MNIGLEVKLSYVGILRESLEHIIMVNIIQLQWLEHLWDYENVFETGIVRAIEGLI